MVDMGPFLANMYALPAVFCVAVALILVSCFRTSSFGAHSARCCTRFLAEDRILCFEVRQRSCTV